MAETAQPSNPVILEQTDVYEAVRQFVLAYALPTIPEENIIQGWQNRSSLPLGTNEFIVISILNSVQHGTNTETFGGSQLAVRGLIEITVQVDFCSETDIARQRAQRIAVVTRSSIGPMFFNQRGMSALYADDARDISYVGSENQFIRRYMVALHLSVNDGLIVDYDYFDQVAITRLENVDVHHREF